MEERLVDFLKKAGMFVLTLLVISILTFILVQLSPGDPAVNYLRASHVAVTEETLSKARLELGLDKPVTQQYIDWLSNAIRGDLGRSYLKKAPVKEVIFSAVIPTFQLGALSFAVLLLLSLILGIAGALYHGRIVDYVVQAFSFICASIPTFWLGYMLIIYFSVTLKWLPVSGRGDMRHFVLPCLTLITPLVGQTSLLIRKSVMEQMSQPHARNAVLRGVDKKYIVFNHLLRNAAIPIVTVLSSNILYLITGSVLIEEVFSWPGVGKMFVSAVQGGDLPLIQGSLLLFGILSITINSLTQFAVHRLDPHLKLRNRGVSLEE
ncbi:ABC transporter permease [Filifactor villosus]|uniref:ABC transporter permease n=1 Tax=Filifactor villosus TaxID=29374 RepID=A0ABV9QHR4_9FIRM